MTIKLVAVDLDGTLLKNDETLSEAGVSALQEAANQDVFVVLCTGRRLYSVQRYAQQMNISNPVIVADGAQVFSAPYGTLWRQYTIPIDVALRIASFADTNGWELTSVIGNATYYKQRPNQNLGEFDPYQVICKTNQDGIKEAPLRLLAHEPDAITGITKLCNDTEFSGIRWQKFHYADGQARSVCIFPEQADKGTALTYLCQKLQVDPSETLAIGDYDNDLSMFEISGLSVAMGNALEHIKAKVDCVAPSNEDDGVAWAINKFVLS